MTSRDIGEFIRELRNNARISLRQLAEQTGVSNPYLSQIERGLRKPSAEVLQQIASALRVSTPLMYLRAGLLAEREGQGVLAAIAADPDLTDRHKKTLMDIYETFRRENARTREAEPGGQAAAPAGVPAQADPEQRPGVTPAGSSTRPQGGTPAKTQAETPAGNQGRTPAGIQGGTPAGPQAETPAGTGASSSTPAPEHTGRGPAQPPPAARRMPDTSQTTQTEPDKET